MDDRTAVLKREQVREGPPMPLEQSARSNGAAATAVRIVAQDTSSVTLELLCECGKRTYVRCDYAAPAVPARAAVPRAVTDQPKQGGGA